MPNVEMFPMLGFRNGSVMAALRIARIATGKKRMINGGAYHGWLQQMMCGVNLPGSPAFWSHTGECHQQTGELMKCVRTTSICSRR
ncbi:MAG: hypothetical protein V8R14_06135 [Clostridia bacterium]